MTEELAQQFGRTWVSNDGTKRRVYFPETLLARLIGLRISTYKTGNISGATLDGEKISNGRADKIRTLLRFGKAYFDCHTQTLVTENLGSYADDIVAGLEALAHPEATA